MSKISKFNSKIIHNVCFNEMEQSEDGTLLKVKLLIHDFKKTPNGWGITEDTAEKRMQYLVNKPIKTKYYSEEENNGIDFLGDHEQSSERLRGTNEDMPTTNTNSIGVINNVYVDYIDSADESLGKALWADGVLWLAENMNVCNLLYDWHSNDIRILTSVEWLYSQSVRDDEGTEWIADPLYSALCVLNSEARGEQPIIYGNYETANLLFVLNQKQYSEFEDAIESDFNKKKENNKKEDDKVDKQLEDVKTKEDTKVINEDGEEAEEATGGTELEKVKKELEEVKQELAEVKEELRLEREGKTDSDNAIAKLNAKVEELTPFKEQVELAKQEEMINERLAEYEEKFNGIGAEELFAAEDTQELIKKTLNEEDGVKAELALSDMLFNLAIKANESKKEDKTTKPNYKEMNSKMDDLIPTASKFEDNYGFKVK